jgi:hypothetical protein
MKKLLVLPIMFIGCMIGENYPPCPSSGQTETTSPPTPTTEPGPYLPPESGDNFADDKKYWVDDAGEICECSTEQLGCVDSPDKVKKSKQPGAYCPFPRENGDPILLGLLAGGNRKWEDTCTCFFTTEECGTPQLHIATDIPGSNSEECTQWLQEQFDHDNIRTIFNPKIQNCKPN